MVRAGAIQSRLVQCRVRRRLEEGSTGRGVATVGVASGVFDVVDIVVTCPARSVFDLLGMITYPI
jgi:hypothetical protein